MIVAITPTTLYSAVHVVVNPSPPGRNLVQVETNEVVLFWELPSVFCQWLACKFVVDGVEYNCTEQYMMAEKAKLFGDIKIWQAILDTNDPEQHLSLGRLVSNFNLDVWAANCFGIVVRGNRAKFSQNAHLRQTLLNTQGKMLVEASETDRFWGIGLTPDDKRALDKANWHGKNMLGEALMVVRSELA